jgi:membrane fusion protein (multidrug efflux system)
MFVRVQLEQAKASNALLLPQQAVARATTGDTVMVVAADGQVAQRPVKLGGAQGGQWVILDGLKAGEKVMVDGFQKLRPGSPVKPVAWTASGAAPAGPAGTAAVPAAKPASAASAPASSAAKS